MIARIIYAVAIAVLVGIVCLFVGGLLAVMNVPPAEFVGRFLTQWAWVLGIVAGLLAFVSGRTFGGLL